MQHSVRKWGVEQSALSVDTAKNVPSSNGWGIWYVCLITPYSSPISPGQSRNSYGDCINRPNAPPKTCRTCSMRSWTTSECSESGKLFELCIDPSPSTKWYFQLLKSLDRPDISQRDLETHIKRKDKQVWNGVRRWECVDIRKRSMEISRERRAKKKTRNIEEVTWR